MKIAFTSCCDPWNDPIQAAWPHLAAKSPDILILLGDNMYMDYGMGKNPYGLYDPRKFDDIDFAKVMHGNYAKQWAVPSFHTAISQIPKIYAIWDDHDFAWNNSRGVGTDNDAEEKEFVSKNKRDISKTLFEQFCSALTTKPSSNQYPGNPYLTGIPEHLKNLPDTGIEQTISIVEINAKLHLLDGRSFRPKPDKTISLLGAVQQNILNGKITESALDTIHLIASGTTLKDWKSFSDRKWLKNIAKKKISSY